MFNTHKKPTPQTRSSPTAKARRPNNQNTMPLDDRAGGFHHVQPDQIFFRPCVAEDLAAVTEMEQNSYPPDEAASAENLKFRQENAGGFFLVGMKSACEEKKSELDERKSADQLVSYVCGTLTSSDTLTHESMSDHDPTGTVLCIRSVVTDGSMRREGIGTKMLRAYCRFVASNFSDVDKILLLCKKGLIGFYEGGGFKMVGPSDVVHGKEQWYEMRLNTAFTRAVMAAGEGEDE